MTTKSSKTLTSLEDLVDAGLVSAADVGPLTAVADVFAVGATPLMAAGMKAGSDALKRQFLPDVRELQVDPSEMVDPIGDAAHSPVPGVVHRHPDRVLLKVVQVCPVYCRFCFRREMIGPGASATRPPPDLDAALDYIADNQGIAEVIMTGGDPLMLSPRRIAALTKRLSTLSHIKVLRWHTRVPIVSPDRVTPELVSALSDARPAVVLALHANHADEFTAAAKSALAALKSAGLTLISQSVLLRDVNDTLTALQHLMWTFVSCGVIPYYLHHGDLAPGTAHFRTSIAKGLDLVRDLRRTTSGLCQPTYVLDLPGGHAKIPLDNQAVRQITSGLYEIDDGMGQIHRYRDVLDPTAPAIETKSA